MKPQTFLPFLTPVVFFALLFIYTKVAGPLPLSVSSVVTQKTDSFSVSGEGKVSVIPDIATVSVGVQSQGTTTKLVQDDLNKKINAISEAVKKLGIDSKDIQTKNYSLNPMYDYTNGKQRITGFQADSTLAIKVRELDKANTVIDASTTAGANTIGGIGFDVEDKTKVENEARQMAFNEAKQKAEMAASIAGFKLGKVINYTEAEGSQTSPVPFLAKAEVLDTRGVGAAPTQVQPGSQEVQMTVTVYYQID